MLNMNLGELTNMMNEFNQFMNNDFWNVLNKMNSIPNFMPNIPNMNEQLRNNPALSNASSPLTNLPLGQINTMMDRLNQFLNNDLMRVMANLNNPNPSPPPPVNNTSFSRQKELIPIQIWETDQQIYVNANLPGLKNDQEVKLTVKDERTVKLRVKLPTFQPEKNSRILESEFPRNSIEREITLPYPISMKSYTSSYRDGVYTVVFHKLEDEIDISIMEE